jgi:polysaccharide export outer membrane protein
MRSTNNTMRIPIIAAVAACSVLHATSADKSYPLGPEDQVTVRILEAQEIAEKPLRIDAQGFVELPLAGRVHAAGMTTEQLQQDLSNRLKAYIKEPHVVVSIDEVHSQPVSVIGAVAMPGLQQIKGRKTLTEMLSLAGGLKPEAGNTVKITRRLEYGRIPLDSARDDGTAQFSVAAVKLNGILNAKNPEQNILIQPYDVISVPKGEMVYVVGEVEKSGGFVLNERESISVLQSLSLAGGLRSNASPRNARILRANPSGGDRSEIAVDLKSLLEGRGSDQVLQPDDILFVPSSKAKPAALRAVEAAISLGTGVVIWRH